VSVARPGLDGVVVIDDGAGPRIAVGVVASGGVTGGDQTSRDVADRSNADDWPSRVALPPLVYGTVARHVRDSSGPARTPAISFEFCRN